MFYAFLFLTFTFVAQAIGLAQISENDISQSPFFYSGMARYVIKSNPSLAEQKIHAAIGAGFLNEGNFDSAMKELKLCVGLTSQDTEDLKTTLGCHANLINIFRYSAEGKQKIIEYFDIRAKFKEKHKPSLWNFYLQLTEGLALNKEYAKAEIVIQEAGNEFNEQKSMESLALLYLFAGQMYTHKDDLGNAKKYFALAHGVAKKMQGEGGIFFHKLIFANEIKYYIKIKAYASLKDRYSKAYGSDEAHAAPQFNEFFWNYHGLMVAAYSRDIKMFGLFYDRCRRTIRGTQNEIQFGLLVSAWLDIFLKKPAITKIQELQASFGESSNFLSDIKLAHLNLVQKPIAGGN